ncbi:hypothetical protein D4R71_07905 [bacterium]|nr:MAG: hypothetical protein D4R71_07905 [bacterium]
MSITSVSSVWSRGVLCLNLPIQTAGRFIHDGILPIPPHTQNIMPICSSKWLSSNHKKMYFVKICLWI